MGGAEPEQQYIERILPAKLRISLDYSRHRDIVSDLVVVFGTLFGVTRLPAWIKADTTKAHVQDIQTQAEQ